MCSPDCPEIHSADQGEPELRNLPAAASLVLPSLVCRTTSRATQRNCLKNTKTKTKIKKSTINHVSPSPFKDTWVNLATLGTQIPHLKNFGR